MNAVEFVNRWRKVTLSERSAAQQHYLDLCAVFDHPGPAEVDPDGSWYTFEKGVTKFGGGRGFADVWKRGQFAWEYKKKHRDLDAAFNQLLQYSGDLETPPLLIACDMDRISVRTQFPGYPANRFEVSLADFTTPANLNLLRRVFHDPESLRPEKTIEKITEEAVSKFTSIAPGVHERQHDPTAFAHFLDRLVFCMFAEDAGLLPAKVFTRIFDNPHRDPRHIAHDVAELFRAMARGGSFWGETVPWFNGNLFDDSPALELDPAHFATIKEACAFDWSQMDPSIFGTLFERVMDPAQRSQLGLHYTGSADIVALVEPVVMAPLRREWADVQDRLASLLPDAVDTPGLFTGTTDESRLAEAQTLVNAFLDRLRAVRVLDPACGSGNFLYVTLRLLKDLENDVLAECRHRGLASFDLQVGPHQLHGLEKNPYAYDLAQMTVWIGHLQWHRDHGYPVDRQPVLQALDTIHHMDAILDDSDPGNPREPIWPEADFIVGNPPFLGGKKLRSELGDEYIDRLFTLWRERVRPEADLCCYWFDKARRQIETGKARRAGLLSTQGIRGGASRDTLKRIKRTGDIFFAESDRPWVINGANVHISMIGFDDGSQTEKSLDGVLVATINSNLTSITDITQARRLSENLGLAFMGDTKGGSFDIPERQALGFMDQPNPNGRPNSDVITPWINGMDVTRRHRNVWIIDFGVSMPIIEASLYQNPFGCINKEVLPARRTNKRQTYRDRWWIHVEPRPAMREAFAGLPRFLVTPRVAKHRLFVWVQEPTLPDCQLIGFARSDDYFFGVLHSRVHEVWALKLGTRLETRPRYTPTTCFETFPFPEPTEGRHTAISEAARRLDELRANWLNPPEWNRTEVLEFPGSVDGPWARYVREADARGIGTVRYPRLVPKDAHAFDLAKRTLTNLYNERPVWLDLAHRALDEAVFSAYGWSPSLSDDALLAHLLALNLDRASPTSPPVADAEDGGDPEL